MPTYPTRCGQGRCQRWFACPRRVSLSFHESLRVCSMPRLFNMGPLWMGSACRRLSRVDLHAPEAAWRGYVLASCPRRVRVRARVRSCNHLDERRRCASSATLRPKRHPCHDSPDGAGGQPESADEEVPPSPKSKEIDAYLGTAAAASNGGAGRRWPSHLRSQATGSL